MISISSLYLIPFLIIYIWYQFKIIDLVLLVSILLIIPFAFFGTFISSPIKIGFSEFGIHCIYLMNLKFFKDGNNIIKGYFENLKWEDIFEIKRSKYNLNINKRFPISIRIFFLTKNNEIFILENTSKDLLNKILYQYIKNTKHRNKNYPRLKSSIIKNVDDLPILSL